MFRIMLTKTGSGSKKFYQRAASIRRRRFAPEFFRRLQTTALCRVQGTVRPMSKPGHYHFKSNQWPQTGKMIANTADQDPDPIPPTIAV